MVKKSKSIHPQNMNNKPSVKDGNGFSLNTWQKKIRVVFIKIINYLNCDCRITSWRFISRYKKLTIWFSKYSDFIRRIIIITIALLIARVVIHFIDISSLSVNAISNYFISIGVMTGGIIAIVFTLSIFAQQSAADLYSSQYFEVYAHDWKEKLTYTVIVIITLLFFGGGIFFNGNPQVVVETVKTSSIYFSLFLIGFIFVLVDWQYKNVWTKVNPLKALIFLEKQAIKFLNSVHKDAKRIAKIIKSKNTGVSEEHSIALVYNNYLSPHLSNLDRQIENLFEISMKLSDRQEINTTNRGIAAVRNILSKFFELRRDSSLILPSHLCIFSVESDSQGFLSKSFERLNNAGEKFIRSRRVENAVFIVDVYKSLAQHSKDIKFINRQYENPIFAQIKGYLSFYVDFAIREKDEEVVFQVAQITGDLALVAVEKNLQTPLLGIQEDLLKLSIFGITEKKTFIIDECHKCWLRILGGLFQYKFFGAEDQITKVLENIKTVIMYMNTAITSGYLSNDVTTIMSWRKPYDEIMMTIGVIVNGFFKLKKEEDKEFYKNILINFFEELNHNLRNLSEEIKNCDSTLIGSVGRLIYQVNFLMIGLLGKKEFDGVRKELIKQLKWNIHLPTLFVHHAESFRASNSFCSLNEAIAKTGLKLFEIKNCDDLIINCVKALYSIVKNGFEKNKKGYGLDESRIMLKIVYLGVLALKQNKQSILTEVGIRIYEFEDMFENLYENKYLAKLPKGINPDTISCFPKKDQLFREVFKWRGDFVNEKYIRYRLMDDAKNKMFELIDEHDIDIFMFEVWRMFSTDSSIRQEIEEKFKKAAQKNEVKKLNRVLQKFLIKKQNEKH